MKQIIFYCFVLSFLFPSIVYAEELSIEDYTKAINESDVGARHKFYLYRGRAYLKNGDINSALSDYSQSILLKPTPESYRERGEIYLNKNKFTSAINDFSESLNIRPSVDVYYLRAEAYLTSEMHDNAIEDVNKIIEFYPDKSYGYIFRMEMYFKMKSYELALADCDKILSIDPNNKLAKKLKTLSWNNKEPQKIVMKGTPRYLLEDYSSSKITDKKKEDYSLHKLTEKEKKEISDGLAYARTARGMTSEGIARGNRRSQAWFDALDMGYTGAGAMDRGQQIYQQEERLYMLEQRNSGW